MTLNIFTDGGSKGNPGPAAIGIAFFVDGHRVDTFRDDIGIGTNNDAEYTAVIRALEIFLEHRDKYLQVKALAFFSDSQLIVRQINGIYKIKHPSMKKYVEIIHDLVDQVELPVTFSEIPREKNQIADALVNNNLDA